MSGTGTWPHTPPHPLPMGPAGALVTLARTGLLGAGTAMALVRAAPSLWRAGLTPAGAYAIGAARFPDRPALVDEEGSWTFAQTDRRVERLAASMARRGVSGEDRVGILCRNHRRLVAAVAAVSRIGADVVLISTSFAPPQVRAVASRERIGLLVVDEDLLPLTHGVDVPKLVTDRGVWDDGAGEPTRVPRPSYRATRYVLLTSGTTQEPRAAGRPAPVDLDPLVGLADRVPLRVGDVALIASPLYHALGFGQLVLALVMSWTVVLQRAFEAEAVLRAIAQHRVRLLVVVPTMLAELAELPPEVRGRYDTSSLRVVLASGSPLGGGLATRFMDLYGDVVYNLYGSTEAAFATVATPADLRAAPGTVGRPLRGVVVRAAGPSGAETPVGVTGRVLVGGALSVGKGAGSPSSDPRLVDTGDLGHFDHLGRLYIDGREDDMIVSGGENVYPQPIEDVLMDHADVQEAAVVGRPHARLGQQVVAFVVARPGHRVDPVGLRNHVRERLPRYMVPKEIIAVGELPHNSLGKTLHGPLRRDAAAR